MLRSGLMAYFYVRLRLTADIPQTVPGKRLHV